MTQKKFKDIKEEITGRISEYPYAIMKRMFNFSHVMVTTMKRVRLKFMFACFAYNVHALKILNG
jgi:hypothetical protein